MKNIKLLLLTAIALFPLTVFSQVKAGRVDTTQHIKLYTCPMHDTIMVKKPGRCPICGMELRLTQKEQMKADVAKTYTCPIHVNIQSDTPGRCSQCGMSLTLSPKEKMKIEVMNNFTCPMHPDVKSSTGGKCPKCGMNLTKQEKTINTDNQ